MTSWQIGAGEDHVVDADVLEHLGHRFGEDAGLERDEDPAAFDHLDSGYDGMAGPPRKI